MSQPSIQFPVLGAKWAIGFTGMFHLAVGALAIGFAFIVTVLQIVAYRRKDRRYDLLAKRVQLMHVCIYNIGTIVAIGLVFALSGLFPQFWSQLFVHLFWTLIVEEFLFFLLATTLTFHYFFWDHLWGHKKLHIFMGALLNPLFLLQFYLINGIGSFMLTPGFQKAKADLAAGVQGWDFKAFYNPSFLMLTAHRAFAHVAYGGFFVAGVCGLMLYFAKREKVQGFWDSGGRLAFFTGFIAFLSLPIIGYFYAYVLKYHAREAYVNLMWGRGDVVALGIDWWWLKHVSVAALFGLSLGYFRGLQRREGQDFTLPRVMIYAIGIFYLMYYMGMGMIMTWKFFFVMLLVAGAAGALAWHLLSYHKGSPRAVFLGAGILSFLTVMLGGYVREASRPRFINRYSHYDSVYKPEQRQPILMVDKTPEDLPEEPEAPPSVEPGDEPYRTGEEPPDAVALIRTKCIGCHTLQRVKNYPLDRWPLIVRQMRAYGLKLTNEEAETIVEHLQSDKPF
jgi:cytochrome bd-type quinol oxidase subunit 1